MTRLLVVVLGMGALVFGGARVALAAGSPPADTVPTTTEPTPTPSPAPTPTPAPDPAPDPAPTPPKPKPAPHVSKPVTRTPKPAPKPAYRPPVVTPAPPPQAQVFTPPAAPKVHRHAAKPRPKVHRHAAKPRRKPAPKLHPKVTRAAPAPPPVVAVEQSIASAPGSVSSPWRRMLLWTLLAASVAGFGLAVLPTIVPRGLLAVEARLPLALLGTLLLVATAGVWLVGVR